MCPSSRFWMVYKKKQSWNYYKYKFQLFERSVLAYQSGQEPSTIQGAVYFPLTLCFWLNLKGPGKLKDLCALPPFLVSGSTSRVEHHPVSQESSNSLTCTFDMFLIK